MGWFGKFSWLIYLILLTKMTNYKIQDTMTQKYDVIIIGGGPAGLTAGIYSSRAGLKTLLIESQSVPAQAILTDRIENYPGFPDGINGFELIEKFKNQAKKFGTEIITGDVKKISPKWQVHLENKLYDSLSLILAVGSKYKKLNVLGEEEFFNKGVSYCAVCDGAFFKDKVVVVVGGGDAAIEETIFLTNFVKKVIVVHRREELRAAKVLQDRVFSNKKVEFIWNSVVSQIKGDEKVKSILIKNLKNLQENEILCDGVFIYVGQTPNTDFLKGIIKLDENGYIITDENMKTSEEGIFACGDCRKKTLRQIVTACAEAAIAVFSAQTYIEKCKNSSL